MDVTSNTRMTRVSGAVAAGVSIFNTASVEMGNFDSITYLVSLASRLATGVVELAIQRSDDNSAWFDAAVQTLGASGTNQSGELMAVELSQPMKRYVRAQVRRTIANSAIDSIVLLQSGAGVTPVTQPAGTYAFSTSSSTSS